MVRTPTGGSPSHPGEMLAQEFLGPLGMSQTELPERVGVPFQRVNRIINQKQAVSPDTALRLGRLFGTTPAFWLNLQLAWDLRLAMESKEAARIKRFGHSAPSEPRPRDAGR